MVTLFHDMMHKEIEVYVDNMICQISHCHGSFSGIEKVVQPPYQVQVEAKP